MRQFIWKFIIILTVMNCVIVSRAFAQEDFETWLNNFRSELAKEGASSAILADMFDGIEFDERVLERDSHQPEFVRPIWVYLEGATSKARRDNGRKAAANIQANLSSVENCYQVDADILTAIWGLESAYGAIMGDFDVVQSLAILAWDGRRRDWAQDQLRAIATMLEKGYANRGDLKGSWAGAMGQTQFIPTTYLKRAIDFDGDGRRDIWANEADALGSAANLLSQAGWEFQGPTIIEINLPADFDYTGWNEYEKKRLFEWALTGARAKQGEWKTRDLYRDARIILPAGANGPAFMVFANFDAIMRYNNSTAYAMGVSYLAKRLSHDAVLPTNWPLGDVPLTRREAKSLQHTLTQLGYSTNGVDGIFGRNSRAALKRYQADHGLIPDGYAGRNVYERIMN